MAVCKIKSGYKSGQKALKARKIDKRYIYCLIKEQSSVIFLWL